MLRGFRRLWLGLGRVGHRHRDFSFPGRLTLIPQLWNYSTVISRVSWAHCGEELRLMKRGDFPRLEKSDG